MTQATPDPQEIQLNPAATPSVALPRIPGHPQLHVKLSSVNSSSDLYSHLYVVGDTLQVDAEVLGDPQDQVQVWLRYKLPRESRWRRAPMRPLEPFIWRVDLRLQGGGVVRYAVEAWVDVFATWVCKHQDIVNAPKSKASGASSKSNPYTEGARLLETAAARAQGYDREMLLAEAQVLSGTSAASVSSALHVTAKSDATAGVQVSRETHKSMKVYGDKDQYTRSQQVHHVSVERKKSRFALWGTSDSTGYEDKAALGFNFVVLQDVDFFVQDVRALKLPEKKFACEVAVAFQVAQHLGSEFTSSLDPMNSGSQYWALNYPNYWEKLEQQFAAWLTQGVRAFQLQDPHVAPVSFWRWLLPRLKRQAPDCLFMGTGQIPGPWQQVLFNAGVTMFSCSEDDAQGIPSTWSPTSRYVVEARDSSVASIMNTLLRFPACSVIHAPDAGWVKKLQHIRSSNYALQLSGNLEELTCSNPALSAFVRYVPGGHNTLIIVMNTSVERQEGEVIIPDEHARELGERYIVEDLLTHRRHQWAGTRNHVDFAANQRACVFRVMVPRASRF